MIFENYRNKLNFWSEKSIKTNGEGLADTFKDKI